MDRSLSVWGQRGHLLKDWYTKRSHDPEWLAAHLEPECSADTEHRLAAPPRRQCGQFHRGRSVVSEHSNPQPMYPNCERTHRARTASRTKKSARVACYY